jgi:hypothetical protein
MISAAIAAGLLDLVKALHLRTVDIRFRMGKDLSERERITQTLKSSQDVTNNHYATAGWMTGSV